MWLSVELPYREVRPAAASAECADSTGRRYGPFVTPRLTREHVGELSQRVCCRGRYGGRCPRLKWRPKLCAACANRKAARATNEAPSCVEHQRSVGWIESQKLDSKLRIRNAVFTAQQNARGAESLR